MRFQNSQSHYRFESSVFTTISANEHVGNEHVTLCRFSSQTPMPCICFGFDSEFAKLKSTMNRDHFFHLYVFSLDGSCTNDANHSLTNRGYNLLGAISWSN